MKPSEIVLLLSGVGIVASVLILFVTGSFLIWVLDKALYGIGVLLFLANK